MALQTQPQGDLAIFREFHVRLRKRDENLLDA
jgi:hypothetical protein